MNPTTSTTWHHLAPNPKSCYKQLFIKGTRVRTRVLYGMFMNAEVNEAIAYCQSNPPEIAQDFEREKQFMEGSDMNDPDYKYGGKFKVIAPEEIARIMKSYAATSPTADESDTRLIRV